MKKITLNVIIGFILISCNQVNNEQKQHPVAGHADSVNKADLPDSKKPKPEEDLWFNNKEVLSSKTDTALYKQHAIKYKDSIAAKLHRFAKTAFDSAGGSAEGGLILAYSNKQDTLKVTGIFYGETGQSRYEYYIKNKKIIAVEETITHYVSPINAKNVKIDKANKSLYILNGREILIDKKGDIALDYDQKAQQLIDIYSSMRLDMDKGASN